MTYTVKEIFYTLQGEGMNAGRPAVFCRFAGCNLWSGREKDRPFASCTFCDTDFVGGEKFKNAGELAMAIGRLWPSEAPGFVVLTGGEPLLQVDEALVAALHERGFHIAVETNGTLEPPEGIDWVCVSPKVPPGEMGAVEGNELKFVFPQNGATPERYEDLAFDHFLIQPMDGPDREANTAAAVAFCKANPRWRLSLQTHKLIGIP